MEGLTLFVRVLLLVPFSMWNGYVLSVLWRWFMAPVFHLPILSLPVAMGISLLIRFLTQDVTINLEKDPWERLVQDVLVSILAPFVFLATGWFIHFFV